MEEYVWYFDGIEVVEEVEKIKNDFPCFVEIEYLELNWVAITVKAREEDIASIERRVAKYA